MLSKKNFIQEQKDCASMLGISLEEYKKSLKNIKAPKKEKKSKNIKYDNSILKFLGLDETMLKKKSV